MSLQRRFFRDPHIEVCGGWEKDKEIEYIYVTKLLPQKANNLLFSSNSCKFSPFFNKVVSFFCIINVIF